MNICIRRRELLCALSGAAAWPLAARAQQRERMRRLGALLAFARNDEYGLAAVAASASKTRSLPMRASRGALSSFRPRASLTHRDVIIAAAARHSLPSIAGGDIWPRAGAVMSYWMDTIEMHAPAMSYVDRILKGEKPENLPVQQPTKFSLIINLKTVKALGLTISPGIRAIADEFIE